jgi:hypothetical protein
MRPTERLDIAAITLICMALAMMLLPILTGCSEKPLFQVSNLVPDSLLVTDTLDVAETAWGTKARAASGMWQSERMVTCDWRGYLARSFIGLSRPDTELVLQSADLYLYATRIEGNAAGAAFEVYTLQDSLMAGDIYWSEMPAVDELVATFTLPDPGPGEIGEDSVFVDLTGLVSQWIGGENDKYGLMLKLQQEGMGAETIAEFGTAQARNRPVETAEGDTVLVNPKPSLRIAYRDTANASDTTLWYLPANDTFSDTLLTPFDGTMLVVGNGFPSRSMVKFDLDVLPEGCTVTRAVLELTVAADASSFDEITIICHGALEPWEGYSTLIGTSGTGTTTLKREDYKFDQDIQMEITPLVEPQVAGKVANYGYVIKSTKEASDLDFVRFYANPRLRVYYALPPDPWYRRD